MAAAKTSRTDATGDQSMLNGDMLFAMGQPGLRTYYEMTDTMLKNMLALHDEMAKFVHNRLEQDIGLQTSLADCDKPGDLFAAYLKFMQGAMGQYWEEMAKLQTMLADNGRATAEKSVARSVPVASDQAA